MPEYLQLSYGYPQVRFVESIRNVPAEWTELSPLLDKSVEETQTEEQLLEGLSQNKFNRISTITNDVT